MAWARGGLERPRLLPHGAPKRVLRGRSSPQSRSKGKHDADVCNLDSLNASRAQTRPLVQCDRLRASNVIVAEDGEDHAPATLPVWTRLFERHPMGWIVPRV